VLVAAASDSAAPLRSSGKAHDNVLRDIRNTIADLEWMSSVLGRCRRTPTAGRTSADFSAKLDLTDRCASAPNWVATGFPVVASSATEVFAPQRGN
jgi:hypothetical protein